LPFAAKFPRGDGGRFCNVVRKYGQIVVPRESGEIVEDVDHPVMCHTHLSSQVLSLR